MRHILFIALFAFSGSAMADIINTNRVLRVPSEFASLTAAVNYLNGATLQNGAQATIILADGTYNENSLRLTLPQGQQVVIRGNLENPRNVVVRFNGNGINVQGTGLKNMDGFTIRGNGTGNGVNVGNGASTRLGRSMIVSNFNNGVIAGVGGTLIFSGTTRNNATNGVLAHTGGTVNAFESVSSNNRTGYSATGNGAIAANGATARNNTNGGFVAAHNGYINIVEVTSIGNDFGVSASWGGRVWGRNVDVRNNNRNFAPQPGARTSDTFGSIVIPDLQ